MPADLLPAAKLREYLGPTATRVAEALAPGEVSEPRARRAPATGAACSSSASAAAVPPLAEIRDEVRAELRRRAGDQRAARLPRRCCASAPTLRVRGRAAVRRVASEDPGARASLLVAASAGAHTRSVSYSSWKLDPDGARVELRISLLELTRLAIDPARDVGSGGPVARYLADHLTLARGGAPCRVDGERLARPAPRG